MEVIAPPPNIKKRKPWKKIIFVLSIVLFSSILGSYLALNYFAKKEEQSIEFRNLSLLSVDNATETITIGFTFDVPNPYSADMHLTEFQLEVFIKNVSVYSWQSLGVFSAKITETIEAHCSKNITLPINITNTEESEGIKTFIAKILAKDDFSFRLEGKFTTSLLDSKDIPDIIEYDVQEKADEFFSYPVSSDIGSCMIRLIDLVSVPTPLDAPTMKLETISYYENPFDFPIQFDSLKGTVYNRTLSKIIGTINWDSEKLGTFMGHQRKNISQTLDFEPQQIAWLVEDLLSGILDVIKIKDIKAQFSIGKVNFLYYSSLQNESSEFKFLLKITRYAPAADGSLILDVSLYNPCGIIFNITYIDLRMYVSGTLQEVLEISQPINVTVLPYTTTEIKNLSVDASYATFIQHLDDTFDLKGKFDANSYHFQGTIYFNSYDVALLT